MRMFFFGLFMLLAASTYATETTVELDPRALNVWTKQTFAGGDLGITTYEPTEHGLLAHADDSASGYLYRFDPPLPAETVLSFQWQLIQPLLNPNERVKAGDDFAGRVYIIQEGRFFWQTQALNYVWSAQSPPDTVWTSPYSRQVRLWAVNGPESEPGQWYSIDRSLHKDWANAFGAPLRQIDGIAFMTDSDDTGSVASMLYSVIRLTPASAH